MSTEIRSLLQEWAALLAVSLGIFAITLDGSMMLDAIGKAYQSIVASAYLNSYKTTLEILVALITGMLAISFMIRTRLAK